MHFKKFKVRLLDDIRKIRKSLFESEMVRGGQDFQVSTTWDCDVTIR